MADVARSHGGDCSGGPGGDPGGGGWQPPSGCQGRGGPKKVRGRTRNKGLKKGLEKSTSKKLPIEFEMSTKDTFAHVGKNAAAFTTLLGTIVSKIPRHFSSFGAVSEEHTSTIFHELQSYFDVQRHLDGPNGAKVKNGINLRCAKMYRDQKNKFKKKLMGGGNELPTAPPQNMPADNWEKFVGYINSPEYVRRSNAGKIVRAKQKIPVRTGSKTMAQSRYENRDPITNEPPSMIEEYIRLRSHKGDCPSEVAENYGKMKQLKDAQVEVPNPLSETDIMSSVIGSSRAWQTGIGPKLPKSLLASSSSQSSQRMYTHSEVEHMLSQMKSSMMAHTAPLFKALNIQPVTISDDEDGEDEDGEEEDEDGENLD